MLQLCVMMRAALCALMEIDLRWSSSFPLSTVLGDHDDDDYSDHQGFCDHDDYYDRDDNYTDIDDYSDIDNYSDLDV